MGRQLSTRPSATLYFSYAICLQSPAGYPNRQMRMAFDFKEEFCHPRDLSLSATISVNRSIFERPPHRATIRLAKNTVSTLPIARLGSGEDDIRSARIPVARDVSRNDHFATGGATYLDTELGAARVAEAHNVLRIVAHEPVAPIADRMQNGEELLPASARWYSYRAGCS